MSSNKTNQAKLAVPVIIGVLVCASAGGAIYSAVQAHQAVKNSEAVLGQLSDVDNNLKLIQSELIKAKSQAVSGDLTAAVKQAMEDIKEDKLAEQRAELYKGWENVSQNAEGRYVYGNPSARFTLANYEDLECPFCKRFHETPKYLVDNAMNGAVNWEWRHYPMPFHEPMASKAAMTVECVGQQKGAKGFWAATNYWFEKTEANAKGFVGMDDIPALFELDGSKFSACMTDKKIIERVKRDMSDGQKDNIQGTPATIITDNKTGRTETITGAQPFSVFVGAISDMVKSSTTDSSNTLSDKSDNAQKPTSPTPGK